MRSIPISSEGKSGWCFFWWEAFVSGPVRTAQPSRTGSHKRHTLAAVIVTLNRRPLSERDQPENAF